MENSEISKRNAVDSSKSPGWVYIALVLLVIEKVIQHIAVTLALVFDFSEIRATLAHDYRFFLFIGEGEAIFFALTGWGLLRRHSWAKWLVILLACADIIGEFMAQGTLMIVINVSILVAIALLGLSLAYRQPKARL